MKTLYGVFKTGKKMGKLVHLAYVYATGPHDALNVYLTEENAHHPPTLIALPISANKVTIYEKSKNQDPRRQDKCRHLKKNYRKISYYNIEKPCGHVPWSIQRQQDWYRRQGRAIPSWLETNEIPQRIEKYL